MCFLSTHGRPWRAQALAPQLQGALPPGYIRAWQHPQPQQQQQQRGDMGLPPPPEPRRPTCARVPPQLPAVAQLAQVRQEAVVDVGLGLQCCQPRPQPRLCLPQLSLPGGQGQGCPACLALLPLRVVAVGHRHKLLLLDVGDQIYDYVQLALCTAEQPGRGVVNWLQGRRQRLWRRGSGAWGDRRRPGRRLLPRARHSLPWEPQARPEGGGRAPRPALGIGVSGAGEASAAMPHLGQLQLLQYALGIACLRLAGIGLLAILGILHTPSSAGLHGRWGGLPQRVGRMRQRAGRRGRAGPNVEARQLGPPGCSAARCCTVPTAAGRARTPPRPLARWPSRAECRQAAQRRRPLLLVDRQEKSLRSDVVVLVIFCESLASRDYITGSMGRWVSKGRQRPLPSVGLRPGLHPHHPVGREGHALSQPRK